MWATLPYSGDSSGGGSANVSLKSREDGSEFSNYSSQNYSNYIHCIVPHSVCGILLQVVMCTEALSAYVHLSVCGSVWDKLHRLKKNGPLMWILSVILWSICPTFTCWPVCHCSSAVCQFAFKSLWLTCLFLELLVFHQNFTDRVSAWSLKIKGLMKHLVSVVSEWWLNLPTFFQRMSELWIPQLQHKSLKFSCF